MLYFTIHYVLNMENVVNYLFFKRVNRIGYFNNIFVIIGIMFGTAISVSPVPIYTVSIISSVIFSFLTIRRLSDIGVSFNYSIFFIPIMLLLSFGSLISSGIFGMFVIMVLIILIGLALVFIPGTVGANQYGPDPFDTPIQTGIAPQVASTPFTNEVTNQPVSQEGNIQQPSV